MFFIYREIQRCSQVGFSLYLFKFLIYFLCLYSELLVIIDILKFVYYIYLLESVWLSSRVDDFDFMLQ